MTGRMHHDVWDVCVVGTGMGGGTVGYALARAGFRVVFVEMGQNLEGPESLVGKCSEDFLDSKHDFSQTFLRAGRYAKKIFLQTSWGRKPYFTPVIGSGVGGSSSLYGAVLERFSEEEMPKNLWPDPARRLDPWYAQAESLFKVNASRLEQDLPLVEREVFQSLRDQNYTPHVLPLAVADVRTCDGCQGQLCPKNCKNHAGNVCVEPAVKNDQAQLRAGWTVVKLLTDGSRVVGAFCRRENGETEIIKARLFILAAGALETPALLLRSVSKSFPNGLANRSGLVGKNLMRHLVTLYLMRSKTGSVLCKGVGLNFETGTIRANLQSFGRMPPLRMALFEISEMFEQFPLKLLSPFYTVVRFFLEKFYQFRAEDCFVLALVGQDRPSPENRVQIGGSGTSPRAGRTPQDLVLRYKVSSADQQAFLGHEKIVDGLLKKFRPMKVRQIHENRRIAHVCGTCKMGENPQTSVVDPWNKCHDVDNLYIVDASYFPTSGCHGPSLTIAANALRVAQKIISDYPRSDVEFDLDAGPSVGGRSAP